MTVSVLLRLITETLAEGRVAGQAEIVDTGEAMVFRDQDEMVAFLQRATTPQSITDGEDHGPEAMESC